MYLNVFICLLLIFFASQLASAQHVSKTDSALGVSGDKVKDSIATFLRKDTGNLKQTVDSISNTLSWQLRKLQQFNPEIKKDSIIINKEMLTGLFKLTPVNMFANKDTLQNIGGSLSTGLQKLPGLLKKQFDSTAKGFKESLKQNFTAGFPFTRNIKPDSLALSILPSVSFKGMLHTKPLVQLNGGWLSYNFNYRSNVDTPFREKNLQQHSSYGYFNLTVAGLPFNANYLIRRSNSAYFRDINDVQVQFDALQFRNQLLDRFSGQMQQNLHIPGDSIFQFDINSYLDKYKNINGWLNDPITLQRMMAYKEIIAVPQITYTPGLPDSINEKRAADANATANTFIKQYEAQQKESALLKSTLDSLEQSYKILKDALNLQKKNLSSLGSTTGIMGNRKEIDSLIPKKYRWLLNIRKFGLGRNQLNYSELTSKNMSLTGVNFEYNSWYYLAFAAGTVDYRFRDFSINNTKRIPQYMTMLRLGIGHVENTHIIASLYRGRKQLYAVSGGSTGITAIDITGIAIEGKWQINHNHYFSIEAAESLSPDFRKNPATTSKFNLNDKSNKALAFKYYLYLPKTFSRIEANYKFTGANFQSFSSFQTNAETISWSVKADQYLFKRQLKVALAIRKNEFSNPYIIQAYTNNTVFKSIQLTYRAKNFPVISAGYTPMSQVTAVDSQLVENIFYSLNVSASHTYKIGIRRASTSVIYNRFYNNQRDTSFLYYKAENIYFTQSISFSSYIMNLSLSHSSNPNFKLTVFDAGILFNIGKTGLIGFGAKINEFSGQDAKTGLYGTVQLGIKKRGTFSLQYNKGYIAGRHNQLVENEIMNLGFTRRF